MIRALCIAGGLAGAVGLSQAPEFSQQYLQRLTGQVEALTVVVKDFDATALGAGLGREQALEQMTGTPLLVGRQADMRRTFARHARLSDNLTALRDASALGRIAMPYRMTDGPTVTAVWADFTPSLPVSLAGAAAAGTGFLGGWAALALLFAILRAPFRRKAASSPTTGRNEPVIRKDPVVSRPRLVAEPADYKPKLAGVQR